MSKYTTGELAKLCGVTVRTVQYYDSRNLLVPSSLSEGGRRLYSEEDLRKLKIICFLRELKLPIESIRQLFQEEHPETVLSALLDQQIGLLNAEIQERQEAVNRMKHLQGELRRIRHFTVESIGDIAHIMERAAKRRRTLAVVLVIGFLMDAIQAATLMVWFFTGAWQPFALGMLAVIGLGVWVSRFYYRRSLYLCPQCHRLFRPGCREMLFARHTPKTRKLTCPSCHHKGFCLETYGTEDSPSC